jgi:hypothetical protein
MNYREIIAEFCFLKVQHSKRTAATKAVAIMSHQSRQSRRMSMSPDATMTPPDYVPHQYLGMLGGQQELDEEVLSRSVHAM